MLSGFAVSPSRRTISSNPWNWSVTTFVLACGFSRLSCWWLHRTASWICLFAAWTMVAQWRRWIRWQWMRISDWSPWARWMQTFCVPWCVSTTWSCQMKRHCSKTIQPPRPCEWSDPLIAFCRKRAHLLFKWNFAWLARPRLSTGCSRTAAEKSIKWFFGPDRAHRRVECSLACPRGCSRQGHRHDLLWPTRPRQSWQQMNPLPLNPNGRLSRGSSMSSETACREEARSSTAWMNTLPASSEVAATELDEPM